MVNKGRPKGYAKTGGRVKGKPNKATAAKVKEIEKSGLTPLDYMIFLLRREIPEGAEVLHKVAMENLRFEAAKAAAPYVHSKMPTKVALGGDKDNPEPIRTKDETNIKGLTLEQLKRAQQVARELIQGDNGES